MFMNKRCIWNIAVVVTVKDNLKWYCLCVWAVQTVYLNIRCERFAELWQLIHHFRGFVEDILCFAQDCNDVGFTKWITNGHGLQDFELFFLFSVIGWRQRYRKETEDTSHWTMFSLIINSNLFGDPENSLVVSSSVLHLKGFVPIWDIQYSHKMITGVLSWVTVVNTF